MKLFSSKLKSSADFYTQIALMLIIVLLVEVIFSLLPIRMDATDARVYSISPVTKETLHKLKDIVTIKGYFTRDVPGYLVTVREQVQDMLREYKNYGGGNVRVNFIDPGGKPEIRAEAEQLGIPPLQFQVVRNDKFEAAQGYMGIAIVYGDTSEVIPVVQDISSLEFDLTVAIKKIISGSHLTVGIADAKDKLADRQDLQVLRERIGKEYTVADISLDSGEPIPASVSTLIIPGARGKFSERELYLIDQFIMSGKGVLIAADGVTVDQGLAAKPNDTNLFNLLASYGATINKDLIYDPVYQGQASFQEGGIQFIVPYGFWVTVPKSGFNAKSALVNTLETITAPWASSISVNSKDGTKTLVQTSSKSKLVAGDFDLSPEHAPKAEGSGSYPIAVELKGNRSSYFKEAVAPEGGKSANEKPFASEAKNIRLIVVSDGKVLTDGFMRRFESSAAFVQNLIDGLTLDEALASIRSKNVGERPIRPLDSTARALVNYGTIIGVPLFVVLFALARFFWRRKSERLGSEL